MKTTIIGTGYVGLVTGVCLADAGHAITCVDNDVRKVTLLNQGRPTIYEPGLEGVFARARGAGRISFTQDLDAATRDCEIIMLALPTPPNEDGSADLKYVLGVSKSLGDLMKARKDLGQHHYQVVVNKSTVPVGTAGRVRHILEAAGLQPGVDFDVVSNPEFLREGVAVRDFAEPDRVVVGCPNARSQAIMHQLYEPILKTRGSFICMDEPSAELTKYAANAFLATKISFINQVAQLCDRVGADVEQVRLGIGSDARIGMLFLNPSIGFGGSCFPKDVKALMATSEQHGYDFNILDSVMEANRRQSHQILERLVEAHGADLTGKRVAVWGLAFKANTDDVRESPAHAVIRDLLRAGATVVGFDPEAEETTRAVLGDTLEYASSMYDAVADADALVVCTEWRHFAEADLHRVKGALRTPLILDGRNLFDPRRMASLGFVYRCVGRPFVAPVEVSAHTSVGLSEDLAMAGAATVALR